VREYTPAPEADTVVRDILDVGRWSGSAGNRQPAEVVVVCDQHVPLQISEHGVCAAAGAPLALVVVTPGDPDRHDLEVFEGGRLAERLLLAASAHALGASISTLKGDGPAVIKHALGIPPERRVWTVGTIGHIERAAGQARPQKVTGGRKPADALAHWDRF
jgi:nitroreductase